jgi:hypothetical protein
VKPEWEGHTQIPVQCSGCTRNPEHGEQLNICSLIVNMGSPYADAEIYDPIHDGDNVGNIQAYIMLIRKLEGVTLFFNLPNPSGSTRLCGTHRL